MILLYYFVVCLILLVVVCVLHELGHMLALRLFRVPIYRLTIGFGPVLFKKRLTNSAIGEIVLKWFPFTLGSAFDGDHPQFQKLGFLPRILIFGM